MYTTAKRLEGLKQSLEAARDVKHSPLGLTGHYLELFEQSSAGRKAGLQLAIDAIEAELRIVAAGDAVAAKFNH